MTCKDCIHEGLCMSRTDTTPFTKTEYRDLDNVEKFCEDFKNKAEFVKVVFCKDCKYYSQILGCYRINKSLENRPVKPDDFCSYGERNDV